MRRHFICLLIGALAFGAAGDAAAEIKIGFAAPLSGPYALTGARHRIAVGMAVDHLNQNGGVLGDQVTLVTVDDACGLHKAVEAAHQLVAAQVAAVIGHLCSHSSLLAAGVYETADILMISPSSTHPRLTEEGRQNVFRLTGRDDHQGALAGDFLAAHWPGDEIAILHDGSTYGEGLALEAHKRLRIRGIAPAIYDVYTPNEQDYTALAARLEATGIAVLYVGGYGPDAARILRALRARGPDPQLVGGDALGMDEFWTIAGPAGEGSEFSSARSTTIEPAAADVLAGFRSRGLGSRSGGLASYAAVQVWAQAVERAGTLELAKVAEMLRRGRFTTVVGPVAFDEKGDLEGAAWRWLVWRDGSHMPLIDPPQDARASRRDNRSARETPRRPAPGPS
jgi:branched-chain amino acid transport system substrate-binding protein